MNKFPAEWTTLRDQHAIDAAPGFKDGWDKAVSLLVAPLYAEVQFLKERIKTLAHILGMDE